MTLTRVCLSVRVYLDLERWTCTFCHLPSRLSQTRVSSDWSECAMPLLHQTQTQSQQRLAMEIVTVKTQSSVRYSTETQWNMATEKWFELLQFPSVDKLWHLPQHWLLSPSTSVQRPSKTIEKYLIDEIITKTSEKLAGSRTEGANLRSKGQRSRSLGTKRYKKSFFAHIFVKSGLIYVKPRPN